MLTAWLNLVRASVSGLNLKRSSCSMSRGGKIVAFAFEEDPSFDDTIVLPEVGKYTAPMLELVAGQLFSYFTAVALNRSIDKPRSLAKSVTVP